MDTSKFVRYIHALCILPWAFSQPQTSEEDISYISHISKTAQLLRMHTRSWILGCYTRQSSVLRCFDLRKKRVIGHFFRNPHSELHCLPKPTLRPSSKNKATNGGIARGSQRSRCTRESLPTTNRANGSERGVRVSGSDAGAAQRGRGEKAMDDGFFNFPRAFAEKPMLEGGYSWHCGSS
jgi:hypothetical protein